MELGGVVMDAGGGAAELGLLGGGSSRLRKHGRGNAAAGAEEHSWGGRAAKQARTAADVAEAAVTPFLLGSCSPGHGGEQMLSFSSAAASSFFLFAFSGLP
ncbi:growth-regulating factor 6-like [Panicum miliaceum]|uniref:Growth-regulating factor 6-like n=1 Tax=Panicum miliaceum TaxID=4540 RepID=A0A3L6SFX8_PANMI|nr:growth-regulating factor 6-like [Panicum miliaceum]